MRNKNYIKKLFMLLAVFLAFFPIIMIFNEGLTRIVQNLKFSQTIQHWIVPVEAQMVGNMLYLVGTKVSVYTTGTVEVNGRIANITWNCIGWQSLLLVGISLFVGLQGKYTNASKLRTIAIGIMGAYLINIARMAFIIYLFANSEDLFAIIYHDILSVVVTLIWLAFFWWFSYAYVLEEEAAAFAESQ